MAKFQIIITLNCGEKVKSEITELNNEEKNSFLEMMEYAAKDDLNYFKFQRDTGSVVYIPKEALRMAKTFEMVEVK